MHYFCCEDHRRIHVANSTDLNGIDFLEVLDSPDQPANERQRTLFVYFVRNPAGLTLTEDNVRIVGGERVRAIQVLGAEVRVEPLSGSTDPVLVVNVDTPGDFSTYVLKLVDPSGDPLPGMDPVLGELEFSFKVNCNTRFDPLVSTTCAPASASEPALDYLARDFPSLRQMILDRLAVLLPDWQERNPADAGIALVELLAYLGDQLSYRQDAVATEGYLGTCRLRTSARRHARLVDYPMHDGCNARTCVQVRLQAGVGPIELEEAWFYSVVPGLDPVLKPESKEHVQARATATSAFRLMGPETLDHRHNEIEFYTWRAQECCLPKGATEATLLGSLANLREGMILIFQEMRSPRTGDPDDAELTHRHAVRLIEVTPTSDPLGPLDPDAVPGPVELTYIRWAGADALPFPVCISAETAEEYDSAYVDRVSVALGNIVLVDHGDDVEESLGEVPTDRLRRVLSPRVPTGPGDEENDRCRADRMVIAPARFRPRLGAGPITQAVPFDPGKVASARAALTQEPRRALPQVELADGTTEPWEARQDLLGSGPTSPHFVVEVEDGGYGRLRFGDGVSGRRPPQGSSITARYRIGNGEAGNIGANTLKHVVTAQDGIESVANPLPAVGGVELESIEEVRQYAPVAFRPQVTPGQIKRPDGRTLERAVTPADYAAIAEANPDVQRAMATHRWTGSWRTVSVAVDRLGGGPMVGAFEKSLLDYLESFRLAGHDLEVDPPRSVALEIAMHVRVKAGYFVSDVRRALLDMFSSRVLVGGRRGVFHPDNLTFGQTVYLSPMYAAAQAVDGVESVDVTTFQRRDRPGTDDRDAGRILLGRLEIARLDNDPNFPERGVFTITLEGGS